MLPSLSAAILSDTIFDSDLKWASHSGDKSWDRQLIENAARIRDR
jgi:hypothetical protein